MACHLLPEETDLPVDQAGRAIVGRTRRDSQHLSERTTGLVSWHIGSTRKAQLYVSPPESEDLMAEKPLSQWGDLENGPHTVAEEQTDSS